MTRCSGSSRFRSRRRTSEQRHYLAALIGSSGMPATACLRWRTTTKKRADQIRYTLQPRQAALSSAVSRLLVQNNEAEELAAGRIAEIYERVQRQLYFFLAGILLAIVLTSLYLIRYNRRLFAHVAELSSQRSELAQKLIATQESTLRHISRELHDEFGQVLTAIGRCCGEPTSRYRQIRRCTPNCKKCGRSRRIR